MVATMREETERLDVGALFDAHAPFLLRVVERLTGAGPHVEDLVQEVFIVLHRRHAELDPGGDVRGWLYRVATHLIHRHKRTIARRLRLADELGQQHGESADSPELTAGRIQTAQRVRDCVHELPMKQREVFVLFELEQLDGPAIASLLGIPEGTVWTRLHAGRKRFRKLWEKRWNR